MNIILLFWLILSHFVFAYQQLTVRNVYSVTPVSTSTFLELVASTQALTIWATVFDSSGQTLALYTGASGNEVLQTLIPPGGGELPFPCPSGTRVTIKAFSATANSGELDINFH